MDENKDEIKDGVINATERVVSLGEKAWAKAQLPLYTFVLIAVAIGLVDSFVQEVVESWWRWFISVPLGIIGFWLALYIVGTRTGRRIQHSEVRSPMLGEKISNREGE